MLVATIGSNVNRRFLRTAALVVALGHDVLLGHATADQAAEVASASAALEFFATAPDGSAVADMQTVDLTLKVSGRTRVIRSLQWIPTTDPPGPDAKPAPMLPPPFGTNVLTNDGRSIVLVLDDDSFRPGREGPLRDAVPGFLATLSSRDRVALVTVPYGGLKVDFTNEHQRVRLALSRIVGQAAADQTGSDLACRTRATLASLVGLLDSLTGGQGPTTVVFVSAGLAPPRRDAVAMRAPGMCELTTDHFAQVGAAASAARAHFFVVLAEDSVTRSARTVENIAGAGFTGSDNPLEGLENLAGVTGGRQIPLLNARESNLLRIARETGGYYLLTFDPDTSERNGNRHAVDLRTSRNGVALRVRPSVVIARRDARPARSRLTPRDMLREARAFRDLPLRAIGYVSQADNAKAVKVLTVAEGLDADTKLTAAAAGLYDQAGRLAAQWTANSEELAATPIMAALVVPPGTYRLRVAATDAAGRGGSADYEVDGDLPRVGRFTTSALVLGVSREGGFRPRLQFGSEPVAIGYLEIYGEPSAQLSVRMELAMSESGPALVAVPAAIQSTSDQRRAIATAALPVGALTAGDFLVRAAVTADGQTTRIQRTLRKVSVAPR
jgi:VWFA-related protein